MLKNVGFLFGIILIVSSSCVRYKNITYVQDRYKVDSVTMNLEVNVPEDIILEPGNNVYINLSGLERFHIESFSKTTGNYSNYTELFLYFQGYLIDDSGYVDLPIVGKVEVKGKSFKEARELIQARYKEFLKGVIVDVRLVSYDITLMGEVNRPGKYYFYKPNINILEAIAQSGNLSAFGDVKNVLVIRNKGAISESVKLDLTDTNVFKNSYYWLEPGDVVYVKPLRAKVLQVNSSAINLLFSTVSMIMALSTFVIVYQ